ncbi:hypothetical protein [Nocardioides mangrovi]|uniref:DUF4245 domain-containing protein n=1 Tax=Nocardioides mangrovi TaxID=2874580 RepID=A0ABS7UAW4_9ACTN|nr:hypothetical protein [Nocardioides mangrovi]MBZ5737969.1 hypothetical protein [Nocardioides mangrovi]
MRVRWMGLVCALVVVLAVVAGLVGYRQGQDDLPTPASFSAGPVPAVRPSYPVTPAKVVPDDDYPALQPGVKLRPTVLGTAPFQARIQVPRGWARVNSQPGVWKWFPALDATKNIYFVRVSQVGVNNATVPAAVNARINALRIASDVDDFVLERQEPDRFVSHYVSEDHLRVAFEGYLPRGEVATWWIAVVGRASDRDGLADLFGRMMAASQTTVG